MHSVLAGRCKRPAGRPGDTGIVRAQGLLASPARRCPLARGSTPVVDVLRAQITGCPARTGIDRLHRLDAGEGLGFPRAHGDRPQMRTRKPGLQKVPPRARGSTVERRDLRILHGAFPGRTGITQPYGHQRMPVSGVRGAHGNRPSGAPEPRRCVPGTPRARESTCGHGAQCPGTQGDRPQPTDGGKTSWSEPPRTGGSRVDSCLITPPNRGYPAHTGMKNPWVSSSSATTGRFPARTGIDLARPAGTLPRVRLPRTHGDRPLTFFRSAFFSRVPPARTGIDRLDTTLARSPHARGSARRRPTESGRRGTTSPTTTAVFAERPSATGERSATTGVDEEREPNRREERDAEKSQDQRRVARRRPRQE